MLYKLHAKHLILVASTVGMACVGVALYRLGMFGTGGSLILALAIMGFPYFAALLCWVFTELDSFACKYAACFAVAYSVFQLAIATSPQGLGDAHVYIFSGMVFWLLFLPVFLHCLALAVKKLYEKWQADH